VAGPNDHPTWDANTKAILARMDTESAMRTENYHFEFMFPTGGNGSGFFTGWHAGLVWEYHTQSDSGHHLAIDGSQKRLHFGLWKPPFTPGAAGYQHFYLPGTVQMDHWYVCDLEIKWAADASGRLRFSVDGQQIVDYSGQTIKAGETRWLQFGFYSRNYPSNEVQFANVTKGG